MTEGYLAKIISIFILLLLSTQSFSIEKCNFELDQKFIKIAFSFYTEDERNELKGFFNSPIINGSLFGNSIRKIVQDLKVFLPYNSINTFNTIRDRLIYNSLINTNNENENQIQISVVEIEKNNINLNIQINGITKSVKFKFDSSDISMQAIGYLDLEDFNLTSVKKIVENKFQQKIWNDLFIDIQAQFNKKCEKEL